MKDEDIKVIKGVAAILLHMSDTKGEIKYTEDALSLLAGQLMDVAERNEANV